MLYPTHPSTVFSNIQRSAFMSHTPTSSPPTRSLSLLSIQPHPDDIDPMDETTPATTFPLFGKLPKELRSMIWSFAVEDFASEQLPIKFYYRDEEFYHNAARSILSGSWETHLRLLTRTTAGDTIYSTAAWFRTRWADLMNTCVFARMVALERLLKAIVHDEDGKNVVVFQHSQRRHIARVLSSVIAGFGERLKQ